MQERGTARPGCLQAFASYPPFSHLILGNYKGFLLLQEENDPEKQEPLQKREDEVKGKKVWELRSLVEQRQVEYMKERYNLAALEGLAMGKQNM